MQKVYNNLISYEQEIEKATYSSKESIFDLVFIARRVANYLLDQPFTEPDKAVTVTTLKKLAADLNGVTNTTTKTKELKEHFEKNKQEIRTALQQFIAMLQPVVG
ncbi:hypothetical protein SAMN05421788_106136 [Filimonas lacunae]|uniref:Uncharacterized protein n=1 Tax=Filimonas lacunae TaxID=477680 RepID=A0A173MF58_9BACT|nr:hypothetical protein [Filimonas lacunae]BAV06068.1 hypothetical protein FLA_2083 [Filimonas lacunae]SIT24510.1 hypothetical protein SAMN05421788_106136 [Filimonas lacunae]